MSDRFAPGPLRRVLAPVGRVFVPRALRPMQDMRASQFAAVESRPRHVVMFGDSITEFGLWQEWFPGLPVLNRGISGERSADLLRRVDTAIDRPAAVFLLIGTNDMTLGAPLAEIVSNVAALLDRIEERAPGTPVTVQSVMPRTAGFRDDIRKLNAAYQRLAQSRGQTYLDLWPALADGRGALRPEFTIDRLHLSGPGYAAWVEVLRPHVERINGVDVPPLIEAELNRRDPERALIRSEDPDGLRRAWEVIEKRWADTVERARGLDPALLHESVDGEWSFIETLRHLVFATDAWVRRTIEGEPAPWHPLGLPHDELPDTPGIPRDRAARPSLDEVLVLRADRMAGVRRLVDGLTEEALAADTVPVNVPADLPGWPEPRGYPVRECLGIVLSEEWEHRRYAERDLDVLEGR